MGRKRQKRIIAITAVVVVIMMILGMLIPMISSRASSDSDLDAQYKRLQQLQSQIAQQQKKIDADIKTNKSQQKDVLAKISVINKNLSVIKGQIDILNDKINDCNARIDKKNKEIAATQKNIEKNTQLYRERVCAMYEAGGVSELQVLLSSKSVGDFLTRYEIIRMISQHDNDLIATLKSEKQSVENAKKDIETQKASIQTIKNTCVGKENAFNTQKASANALYNQLKNKKAALDAASDDADKAELEASRKIQDIIRQMQENAARNGGGFVATGSGWLWPIQNMPGQYISSPFGPRAGHSYPHTGIDIAAGGIAGHPILAANDGKVLIAGYDSSGIYGNYVVLDNGNGMTSLYGHCMSLNTSVGSIVKRGQVIAYVGNTGNVVSLGGGGYHLHFQIMINGTPVNPLNYVSKP